jgi:O-antigen/teichoic acid export membrane protein
MSVNIERKQNSKNILMNVLAFSVQFIISFYISPIIVSKVGASAYGFIGLANDFVSYASILATVFNSVASRFIADAFYRQDYEKANKYFNSLVVANFVVAGILGGAGIVLIPNLVNILSIPIGLVIDVELTFALIFASYVISLITLVFTTSTFVTNRTDVQGIRNIIQYIVRFALIIILLNFVSIRIYWVAVATLVATIIVAIMNVDLTRRLTPELRINLKDARKEYALDLAKSGCWMALGSVSTILLRGLDLTVANLLIGDYEMGLLSIARTMPNNVTSVITTIAPIFTPVFIAFFTKGDINGLINNVRRSINTMALLLFVPITGFIVFSYDFYTLWQKSLSEKELLLVTLLSILTVIQSYFDSTTSTMAQLSVIVNKLRLPVVISLGCGIISIITEIIMIKMFGLGLYAIVLSTTVVMIIRYTIFNSVYAAWCLKQKKWCFISTVLKTWLSIPILLFVMLGVKIFMPINSWGNLCVDIVICGGLGYFIMFLLYGRDDLKKIIHKNKKKG